MNSTMHQTDPPMTGANACFCVQLDNDLIAGVGDLAARALGFDTSA